MFIKPNAVSISLQNKFLNNSVCGNSKHKKYSLLAYIYILYIQNTFTIFMPTEISSNEITKSRQNPKYCYLLWRYIHHLNIYIFFHVHKCAVAFMLSLISISCPCKHQQEDNQKHPWTPTGLSGIIYEKCLILQLHL